LDLPSLLALLSAQVLSDINLLRRLASGLGALSAGDSAVRSKSG
jgi:hypothetical protein